MTPAAELAALRDRVARARLEDDATEPEPGNRLGWSPERLEAGRQALAALREADRRIREKPKKRRRQTPVPPGPPDPPAEPRCVYCGQHLGIDYEGSPATCLLHDDLPALDPHYDMVPC